MLTVDVYQIHHEGLVRHSPQMLAALLDSRPCGAIVQAAVERNLYQIAYRVAAESLEDAAATIRGHGNGHIMGSPGAGNDRLTGRSDLYVTDHGEAGVFNDPDFNPYHGLHPALGA